jgi:hypothetical protein
VGKTKKWKSEFTSKEEFFTKYNQIRDLQDSINKISQDIYKAKSEFGFLASEIVSIYPPNEGFSGPQQKQINKITTYQNELRTLVTQLRELDEGAFLGTAQFMHNLDEKNRIKKAA